MFTRVGSEFQANATTLFQQDQPSVAALSNGQFVVAWRDQSAAAPDTSGKAVRARRFFHPGAPAAAEFVVNTTKAQNQEQPSVGRILNNGFVVAWADDRGAGADKSGYAVRGQRFTNAGARLHGEFQLNQFAAGDQDHPAIAPIANGGFAGVWKSGPTTGTIRGRAYTAAGARNGDEFRANAAATDAAGVAREPAVAELGSGFVVAFTDLGPRGGGSRGSLDIMAQRFSAQGVKLGARIIVNTTLADIQQTPSVAGVGKDKYVVVWEDDSRTGTDKSGAAVRGQIVSAGQETGAQFLVPTHTAGDQHEPAVAAFPNGRFIAVWTDESGSPDDTSGGAVRAQLYSSAGAKIGGEFRVNARTLGDQGEPAVAVFDNTDFVVVWTDLSFGQPPDQSATGIRGQVFHLNH